jgi:hypothetical protein
LESKLVLGNVHVMLIFEFLNQEFLEHQVEIFSSEGSISIGSLNLENTSRNLKDGDIESTTSKIVDCKDLSICLIQTKSKGCCSWLINNSLNLEVCNFSCILRCLSLGIVEVSWNGNDSLFNC